MLVYLGDLLELLEEFRLLFDFFLPSVLDRLCLLLRDCDDLRLLLATLPFFFDIQHSFLGDSTLNLHLLVFVLLKRAGNSPLVSEGHLQFTAGWIFNHFKLQTINSHMGHGSWVIVSMMNFSRIYDQAITHASALMLK